MQLSALFGHCRLIDGIWLSSYKFGFLYMDPLGTSIKLIKYRKVSSKICLTWWSHKCPLNCKPVVFYIFSICTLLHMNPFSNTLQLVYYLVFNMICSLYMSWLMCSGKYFLYLEVTMFSVIIIIPSVKPVGYVWNFDTWVSVLLKISISGYSNHTNNSHLLFLSLSCIHICCCNASNLKKSLDTTFLFFLLGFDDMDSIYASPDDFKSMKQRDRVRGLHLLEYFVNRCHQIGVIEYFFWACAAFDVCMWANSFVIVGSIQSKGLHILISNRFN